MPHQHSPAMSNNNQSRNNSYSTYSKTNYSDSYSDYSDSFYSDESDREPVQRAKTKAKNTNSVTKTKLQGAGKGRGLSTIKPFTNKKPNGTGRGGKAAPKPSPRDVSDQALKRMLSARKLKINDLRNEIEELNQHLTELQQENKYLKRQHAIRERQLVRYEDQEHDVPYLIQKHAEELRAAKDQARKQKERAGRFENKIKETDENILKLQKQCKRMKSLIEDKNLGERDELSRKLTKAESDLDEKDRKILDIERHLEHLQKNHKHELGIERARQRETQRKLQELQLLHEKTQVSLREKEKELDVRNIYSNRLMRAPHRLGSTNSSPAPTNRLNLKIRKKSDPQLTPRQKMKLFEQKRREEEKSLRETREHRKQELLLEEEEIRKEEERKKLKEIENRKKKLLEDEAEQEELKRLQEERKRIKQESEERRQRIEREKQESEEREKRERLKQQIEQEKRELEEKQLEEQKRIALEEKKQSEEISKQVEKERIRREEETKKVREEASRLANLEAEKEKQKQKEILLAKMKAIDDSKSLSPSKNKSYTFTRPVENLHNGVPTNDNLVTSSRRGSQGPPNFLNDLGGDYQPTFTSNAKSTKPNKDLMSDLFGSSKNTMQPFEKNDETPKPISNISSRRKNGDSNQGIDMFGNNTQKIEERQPTPPSGNPLLPRRQRQGFNTFQSRPAVNAIDDIDDDLEEVTL